MKIQRIMLIRPGARFPRQRFGPDLIAFNRSAVQMSMNAYSHSPLWAIQI
jgi:hypothetical protein